MKALFGKIYAFCRYAVMILCLLLSVCLFAASFFLTSYSTDMESQRVLFRRDNLLWNLLGTAVFLAVFLPVVLGKRVKVKHFLALTLFWCCLSGVVLILFGRNGPSTDGMSIYLAAQELAQGQTAVIDPDNSYFSYYPQQMGLVAFYELLIRFWNLLPFQVPAWHFIKCVNVLFACFIIIFQMKTVHLFWDNERIDCCYLLLVGLNLPFLMYTSFVYGEIPSFAFVAAGIYLVLRFLEPGGRIPGWRSLPGGVMCLSAAVVLRKNNLIFVIAVLIVVFLQFLKDWRRIQLLFVVVCAVCAMGSLPGVQKIYELRSGSYLRSGVPAAAYLAMGMQDFPETRCGGWYNGYNFEVYQQASLDADAASEISREVIRERMGDFRANPGYAADFYCRKELSQWADGTYASRQATLATFGGRSSFFQSLYEGELSGLFIEYGNLYQNILYLGLLVFCVFQCRRIFRRTEKGKDENTGLTAGLPLWIGLIGVVGGFLFHTAWEANSRYILLYSLAMLPCSAWGIYCLEKQGAALLGRFRKGN